MINRKSVHRGLWLVLACGLLTYCVGWETSWYDRWNSSIGARIVFVQPMISVGGEIENIDHIVARRNGAILIPPSNWAVMKESHLEVVAKEVEPSEVFTVDRILHVKAHGFFKTLFYTSDIRTYYVLRSSDQREMYLWSGDYDEKTERLDNGNGAAPAWPRL